MNFKLLQGYLLTGLTVLVLAAAAFVLIDNAGNDWMLHLPSKDATLSRSAWLLLAAASGVLIFAVLRWVLPTGVRSIRAGKLIKLQKQTATGQAASSSAKPGGVTGPAKQDNVKLPETHGKV